MMTHAGSQRDQCLLNITRVGARVLVAGLALVAADVTDAQATPLGAEACAGLRQQLEALETSGVRGQLASRPTSAASAEHLQRVRLLMQLDGQLRFRCGMYLPLSTLKPDPAEEVAELAEAAPAVKAPVAKLKKATTPKTGAVDPVKKAGAATATVKTGSVTEGPALPAAKDAPASVPRAKRAKVDDAYQPPAAAGGAKNGSEPPQPAQKSN